VDQTSRRNRSSYREAAPHGRNLPAFAVRNTGLTGTLSETISWKSFGNSASPGKPQFASTSSTGLPCGSQEEHCTVTPRLCAFTNNAAPPETKAEQTFFFTVCRYSWSLTVFTISSLLMDGWSLGGGVCDVTAVSHRYESKISLDLMFMSSWTCVSPHRLVYLHVGST
jgi:hypothetical protein